MANPMVSTNASPTRSATATAVPGRFARLLRIGLGVGLTGLLLVACSDSASPPDTDLLGRWATDAPAYQGRLLEVQEQRILFWTSPYASTSHPLERVERSPDQDGERVYRLEYREHDGALASLEIIYRPGAHPELRFAHRSEVWTRARPQGDGDV
jgi:hypothetical protein